MLYLDEETRLEFHKSSTLLQIICQMVDFECAKFTEQIEVIAIDDSTALLQALNMGEVQMREVCMTVNKQFKRRDREYTCRVGDSQLHYIKCMVTQASDLEHN